MTVPDLIESVTKLGTRRRENSGLPLRSAIQPVSPPKAGIFYAFIVVKHIKIYKGMKRQIKKKRGKNWGQKLGTHPPKMNWGHLAKNWGHYFLKISGNFETYCFILSKCNKRSFASVCRKVSLSI